ncbi:hypothetical protein K5549_021579, partial [Capra hircus]
LEGDHYTPSNAYMLVKAYTNFDAEWDVLNTEMAIRTKDVVEVNIINNLTIYSKEQRHITFACQRRTEKGLASAVKSDLSSHLEKVIWGLLKTPAQYKDSKLNGSSGKGTHDKVLIRIMEGDTIKIGSEFKGKCGGALYYNIQEDSKSNYQEVLLCLSCRGDA